MAQKKEKRPLYRKLKNKFRLVILNDDNFEEKFSLILSPLNVFTWGGLIALLLITITFVVIAFTPLREYIPGYADVDTRRRATYAYLTADSLELQQDLNEQYLKNVQTILTGGKPEDHINQTADSLTNYGELDMGTTSSDSALRAQIESEDQYSIRQEEDQQGNYDASTYFFFTPLKGTVSSSFNAQSEHFGVDVLARKNEAIKATLDGTVVLATWTSETGHIIEVQHSNNLISVYKHNSVLLKKAGQPVKAGEAIAIIGESGELSEGPHLHFELWHNGKPVNPEAYMIF